MRGPRLTDQVCGVCGERNAPGTQFCVACHTFLGWDGTAEQAQAQGRTWGAPATELISAQRRHAAPDPAPEPAPGRGLRVVLEQREVQVEPGGEPAAIEVRIFNASTIVDAYIVEVPQAPLWLQVRAAEVRLLPNTDEAVRLTVHIPGHTLVTAHESGLAIRVRSVTDAAVVYDDVVALTVLAIDVPIGLRLEPSILRVKDSGTGQLRLVADNRRGNRPVRVSLAGRDPELVVRFTFTPQVLEIPAGHITSAHIRLDAPHPEAGEESTRHLTVSAADGPRTVEAAGTFVQASSPATVDVPMALRLEPSLIRVRDRASGEARLVADNRGGSRPLRVSLAGRDPERIVAFSFTPAILDIPAWGTAAAQVRIHAPRPDGGQEATRHIAVSAWDGQRAAEATGNFVQTSSDRRPIARILLTLFGGLAMLVGAFAPWTANPRLRGVEWTYLVYGQVIDVRVLPLSAEAQRFVPSILISAGLVIIVLGALAILGLTGARGRLTRVMALLGAVFLTTFLVVLWLGAGAGAPASGAVIVYAGCVAAFVGGILARR